MTTLHMDVSSVRDVKRKIIRIRSQIEENLLPLRHNVRNLQPQWKSDSADQFYEQFGEVEGSILEIMDLLNDMASDLDEEIVKWEKLDDKLG